MDDNSIGGLGCGRNICRSFGKCFVFLRSLEYYSITSRKLLKNLMMSSLGFCSYKAAWNDFWATWRCMEFTVLLLVKYMPNSHSSVVVLVHQLLRKASVSLFHTFLTLSVHYFTLDRYCKLSFHMVIWYMLDQWGLLRFQHIWINELNQLKAYGIT